MIRLSKHFMEKWRERLGTEPDPRAVMDIIRDPGTVIVQRCRNLQMPATGEHYRQAAIYWNAALGMVLKVDEFRGVAITVLVSRNHNGNGKRRLEDASI